MQNCSANNCGTGLNSQTNFWAKLINCVGNNNSAATSGANYQIQSSFNTKLINCYSYNSYRGISIPYSANLNVYSMIAKNNAATVSGNCVGVVFYNLQNTDDVAVANISGFYSHVHFQKYRGVAGDNFTLSVGATYGFRAQTTERHTANGYAWEMNVIGSALTVNHPLEIPLAKVLVEDGVQKIVKVWCKKSHATNVGAALLVPEYQNSWITTESVATKTNNTSWEELSITLNPTETGVIEVYARAWYVAAGGNVFWDDFSAV
jgi:hypothetical protein